MKEEFKSILTKNQKKKVTINNVDLDGEKVDLCITLRYDDECGNGHNSFSITGTIYEAGKRSDRATICCGCVHDEIKKIAPEYSKYIKWHLMSSDEPMHYIANTIYHASKIEKYNYFVYIKDDKVNIKRDLLGLYNKKEAEKIKNKYGDVIIFEIKPDSLNKEIDLKAARSSAIAPNATLEQLQSKEWLTKRLPKLIFEFKEAMEELGFIY